jgi:hypothetical protein
VPFIVGPSLWHARREAFFLVWTLNQRAVGSTSTRPTKFLNDFQIFRIGYVNLVPKRPMSAGFPANLGYFKLDFLDKDLLRLGKLSERFCPYCGSTPGR